MIDFGTAAKPLRPSQLNYLVLCHWRALAKELEMLHDESGKAADTGSAVHFAVAAFHKKAGDEVAKMRSAVAAFPLADLDEAERIYGRYVADPRNRDAEVVAVEQEVVVSLDAKFLDTEPIVIAGTLDQLRWNAADRRYEVWDIKTGNRDPLYFQNVYALQMAAYVMAARNVSGGSPYDMSSGLPFDADGPIVPGGYIRTKGYFTRGAELPSPHGVFVPAGIGDPDSLLDAVRWAVCAIRSGYVVATPGDHCGTCSFAGNEFCLPKLQSTLLLRSK